MHTGIYDPTLHSKAWCNFKQIVLMWNPPHCSNDRLSVMTATQKILGILRDRRQDAPNDLYHDDENNEIILEWQYQDDRIVRLSVQNGSHGELMTTYGDGRATEWHNVQWDGDTVLISDLNGANTQPFNTSLVVMSN